MAAQMPLDGRIALVTGASRGIGRAVALALAGNGAHVIAVARTLGALEELDDDIRKFGGAATLVQLDLSKGDRVDQLGPSLFQRWQKIDILIANAGMLGPLSPLAHVTEDGFTSTLYVNLVANWRLVRTLDPLLRRSDAGRAVFVTSGAASGKYAYWGPYAIAKAGLEAMVRTYATECATTPVRANLINPGGVATAMRAKAFPGENPETLPSPADVAPLFVELSSPACQMNGQIVDFREWQKAQKTSAVSPV